MATDSIVAERAVTTSAIGDDSAAPAPPPPSRQITALEEQVGLLFAKGRTLMRDRALQVHPDLSPAGYTVVSTLVRSGPQHAGRLAATLFVDKSVMSRMLKQLGELGLIERRPDPQDGRAFYIAASPAAVRKVNSIRDEGRRQLHEFLAGWDVQDIEQLTALLARLNEAG